MTRNAINNLLVAGNYQDQLLQRGKILTWPRKKKEFMLEEYNIGMIVNFWPKVDADFNETSLDAYLFLPCARSEMMLEPRILQAARYVAEYVKNQDKSVLVLCEAGKTRSVFFCALVLIELMGCDRKAALDEIDQLIPNHSLKDFMIDYLMEDLPCST